MKITALLENETKGELKARHGLSLYVETRKHNILFDLGEDNTLFENAAIREIDLSKVDIVILSHGHKDHGGALEHFLEINSAAKIYVQRKAFEPYYYKARSETVEIGLDRKLETHPQMVLLDGDYQIDEELYLFTVEKGGKCHSSANDFLYDQTGRDSFIHEQNLIITEQTTALIMGCGHTGIVNIMDKAKSYEPSICVGGFHLYDPITKKTVPSALLTAIANELSCYQNTKFYTCHCTGMEAFHEMSRKMANLFYFSCGETLDTESDTKG